MIKSILRLAAILVVGILFYNYFLGTPTEKEQSKKVFSKVKDLGRDAWDLLKTEKEKLDEGKYDEALDKITTLLNKLKRKAEDIEDSGIMDQIADLERKRSDLERKLNSDGPTSYDDNNRSLTSKGGQDNGEIKREFEDLVKKTESIMKKMEKE